MLIRIVAFLLLFPSLAWAEAAPVFSDTGPEAEAYGAPGYPVSQIGPNRLQQFLVGAFSHFGELNPTHAVRRPAQPFPLKRASSEMGVSYSYQDSPRNLADYLKRHPTTGLLILRGDTILFEHYQYARRDTDRFTSHSMAKTITGMLIGIAISEGAIRSVDDPASAYVPELAGSEIGKTPIRALLHMASGIEFTEVYDGKDDAAKMNRELVSRLSPGAAAVVAQFNNRTAPPDKVWHYAGLNSETLGLVLSRAVKMSVAAYAESRIWQKIGAEADASWGVDRTGQEMTACCFIAVLRDWGRLGLLLANDGAWNGVQVVPRQWVLDATTPAALGSFLAPRTATPFYGYGYQVWLMPHERRIFAFLGIHGQVIFVDPQSKFVLVHTAARKRPSGDPMGNELIALWIALLRQHS